MLGKPDTVVAKLVFPPKQGSMSWVISGLLPWPESTQPALYSGTPFPMWILKNPLALGMLEYSPRDLV